MEEAVIDLTDEQSDLSDNNFDLNDPIIDEEYSYFSDDDDDNNSNSSIGSMPTAAPSSSSNFLPKEKADDSVLLIDSGEEESILSTNEEEGILDLDILTEEEEEEEITDSYFSNDNEDEDEFEKEIYYVGKPSATNNLSSPKAKIKYGKEKNNLGKRPYSLMRKPDIKYTRVKKARRETNVATKSKQDNVLSIGKNGSTQTLGRKTSKLTRSKKRVSEANRTSSSSSRLNGDLGRENKLRAQKAEQDKKIIINDQLAFQRMRELEKRRLIEKNKRKEQILKFILSIYPTDNPANVMRLNEQISRIPIEFSNSDHYGDIFQPHMYREAFAQLQRAYKEEEFPSEEAFILSASDIDNNYVHVTFSRKPDSTLKRNNDKYWYSQYDYIKISIRDKILFGYRVHTKQNSNLVTEEQRQNILTVRIWKHRIPSSNIFQPNILVNLQKICAMAPIIRIFRAIHSIEELKPNIANTILKPSSYQIKNVFPLNEDLFSDRRINLTDAFKNYLYNNFNSSQINAIINVYLKEEGITLVHGPPGTGKTFTVAGIIATILRDREKAKTLDKKRVLVCAPSNAAVDELLLRISSNGLIDQNGRRYFPKIVRLGVKSRISEEISLLFIDNIVEKEIRNRQNNLEQNYREQYAKLSRELEITQKEIEKVRTSIQTASASNNTSKNVEAMQINLDTMNERKQTLIKQLSNLKIMNLREMQKISHQQLSIRKQIIASADIFGTTLGSITNQDLPSLSSIIIDESCQSVEPDCIAPLVYNNSCKSIALIGDPQQLPPTVLSNYLSNSNYEQSLMERLLAAGSEKIMLDIQYRMHPSIAYFPSKVFYSGKLLNGPNCGKDGDWLYKSNRSDFKIAPYQIFDLTYSKESLTKNNSIKNEAEAQYVAHLYCSIMDTIENPEKLKDSIGIISPYRQQVTEIKYWISKFSGSSTLRNVQVATVDAFQGKEKDIIIFSCVRSALGNDSSGIGFLEDVRRMNVAITRAKYVLYIVCNSYQLSKNPIWRELINDSIQHKCYQRIESPPSRLSSYSKYFILPSNSASRSESLQSRDVERKEILKPSISKATTSDEIGSSNRISSTNKELSFSSIPIPQKVATVNMEHTSNESFASNNSLISNNMKVIEINAQTSNLKPITSVMKVFDKETNSNVSLTRNKPDKEPLSNIISSSRKAPTSNNIRTSSSYKVISANKEPKTNKITAPSNCLLNKKPVETKLIDLHLSDPRFKILKQKPHVLK